MITKLPKQKKNTKKDVDQKAGLTEGILSLFNDKKRPLTDS
jgi:hypothetical protein